MAVSNLYVGWYQLNMGLDQMRLCIVEAERQLERSTVFTSDDLAPCVRLALQKGQQDGGLIRAVHAGLDRLLKHSVDWSRTKMVRKLLHQLSVQTWAVVPMFVHVDAHCEDTKSV